MKIISRSLSFAWMIMIYLLALAAATAVYSQLHGMHILLATFLADAAATLVVWLFGVALGNSSAYDPYWSAAPIPVAVFWAAGAGMWSFANILFLFVLLVWSVRLTANWARRWNGLAHQDWRYTMFRQRMPRLWFLVNLFGINLMPTVLVYLAMVPVYFGLVSGSPVNLLTAAGFLLSASAIWMEHAADRQMDAYQRRPGPKSPHIAEGLWLLCRHPNYLGEILFWWGLWAMQMSLSPMLWTIAGPVAITLLFIFISIPMMEKHVLESRPDYGRVVRDVPMLLPSARKLAGLFNNRVFRNPGMPNDT